MQSLIFWNKRCVNWINYYLGANLPFFLTGVYYTSVNVRNVRQCFDKGLPYQVMVRPRGVEEVEVAGSVAVDGDERARCSVKSLRPADGISPTTRPDDPRVASRSASGRLHRYKADRKAPLTSSSELLPPLSSLSWRFSPQAR